MKYLILFLVVIGISFLSFNQIDDDDNNFKIDNDIIDLITAPTQKLHAIDEEIDFWQKKFNADKNQTVYKYKLGLEFYKRFNLVANLEDLYHAKNLLEQVDHDTKSSNASYMRSLARIYISLHEFQKAYKINGVSDLLP